MNSEQFNLLLFGGAVIIFFTTFISFSLGYIIGKRKKRSKKIKENDGLHWNSKTTYK